MTGLNHMPAGTYLSILYLYLGMGLGELVH